MACIPLIRFIINIIAHDESKISMEPEHTLMQYKILATSQLFLSHLIFIRCYISPSFIGFFKRQREKKLSSRNWNLGLGRIQSKLLLILNKERKKTRKREKASYDAC